MVVERVEVMPALNVPYFSQKDDETNDRYGRKGCGLTALRMVLAYYGAQLTMEELDELVIKSHAYIEEKGWIHAGMIDIARGLGLRGYRINYTMLSDQDLINAKKVLEKEGASEEEFKKFSGSFDRARREDPVADLRRLIDQGIPVIASMEKSYAKTLASHMTVLMGYEGDQLITNDPWDFGPNYKVSVEEFQQHWTKRIVVITSP